MTIDLAAVFRDHLHELNLTPYQKKIAKNIMTCRTGELGSHVAECSNEDCNYADLVHNSCQNGNCPKCQTLPQLNWAKLRMDEVLPVEYMNIVIHAPNCLRKLIQYNPKRGLNALSHAVNHAIHSTFAPGDNHLGILAAIHTTSQLLNFSPHIHCLVPKGYLNSDKTRWIQINKDMKNYKRKLSVQVKIHLLKELNRLNADQKFLLPKDNKGFESIIEVASKKIFELYIEDNVEDIDHAIKYLADKSKKVIINNHKIVDYKDNKVTISYSDRRDKNTLKKKEIDAVTFLKRFVINILPSRFMRIRYYGFLSNSCKKKSLDLCKILIKKANIIYKKIESKVKKIVFDLIIKFTTPQVCPVCKQGVMLLDGL